MNTHRRAIAASLLIAGTFASAVYAAPQQFVQTQELAPPDGGPDDQFGRENVLHDRWLIVGSARHDHQGLPDSGAVYLYERVGGQFVYREELLPNQPQAEERFGHDVDFDGELLVVGAPDPLGGGTGSVYVYSYDQISGRFTFRDRILPPGGTAGWEFGKSVSLSQTRILAGAFGNDSAHLFERVGAVWTEVARFQGAPGSAFGDDVALSGDRGIIGAVQNAYNGVSNSGGATLIERVGGTWTSTFFPPPIVQVDGVFGGSVDIDGDVFVSASYGLDNQGVARAGVVFVYRYNPGTDTWDQDVVQSPQPRVQGYFGDELDLRGDELLIGATDAGNRGSAWLTTYDGASGLWDTPLELQSWCPADGRAYGLGTTLGEDHLVIGAPFVGSTGNPTATLACFDRLDYGFTSTLHCLTEAAPVTLEAFGGDAQGLLGLVLVRFDGVAMFQVLGVRRFDDQGDWSEGFQVPGPPPVGGPYPFELQVFGKQGGKVRGSNRVVFRY